MRDIIYACKSLVRAKGLTLASVIVLGLGIGGAAAVYSVVDALMLHPLAVTDVRHVVAVWESLPDKGVPRNEVSGPNFLDWRAGSRSFAHLVALAQSRFVLTGTGRPRLIDGALVSADYFEALGIRPVVGRTFRDGEDADATNRVAVLGAGLWEREFGADPGIIGRAVTLNALPYTIIGIAPAGTAFPAQAEIWVPLSREQLASQDRGSHYLWAMGRLVPGATIAAARAELATIAARLAAAYPATNTGRTVFVAPLRDDAVRGVTPALLVLSGAMLVLLLTAYTNVVNLLLVRAATRRAELAVRASLGATRGRLVRQLLTESLVLAIGGGMLGLAVAATCIRAMKAMIPAAQSGFILGFSDLQLDGRILAAAVFLSLVTAAIVGVLPALKASSPRLVSGARTTGDRGTSRLRDALVVAEVSLALVLLIGAGLMVRSYARLIVVEPGFRTDHVLTADVALPMTAYDTPAKITAFYDRVLARLRAAPGVLTAGATSTVPLCDCNQTETFAVVGDPAPPVGDLPEASARDITPGYFATLGIPVRRGRDIDAHDALDGQRVMVVSDAFVRRFLGRHEPIGAKILATGDTLGPFTVVGVVGDVRHMGLSQPFDPEMYVPLTQDANRFMTFVVHTGIEPRAATSTLIAAVAAVDPDQPVTRVLTMADAVEVSRSLQSMVMRLLLVFGAVASLLAAIGIYGVIAYSVSQRTREIGIRVALGAQRRSVLRLVVGQGLQPVGLGLALGVGAAVVATRSLGQLLYGVSPTDAPTFVVVAVGLAALAALASYLPARRAARVDPVVALRAE